MSHPNLCARPAVLASAPSPPSTQARPVGKARLLSSSHPLLCGQLGVGARPSPLPAAGMRGQQGCIKDGMAPKLAYCHRVYGGSALRADCVSDWLVGLCSCHSVVICPAFSIAGLCARTTSQCGAGPQRRPMATRSRRAGRRWVSVCLLTTLPLLQLTTATPNQAQGGFAAVWTMPS